VYDTAQDVVVAETPGSLSAVEGTSFVHTNPHAHQSRIPEVSSL
jgi:hypothetical protein